MHTKIDQAIKEHQQLAHWVAEHMTAIIAEAATDIIQCLRAGNTVYWCGNGGSAADAEHLSAELLGRFQRERAPLRSVSLTVNAASLTALANDYGFENIFSRQIEGLGRKGDILVCISTSGNSENVRRAAEKARTLGVTNVGLLGNDGGKIRTFCDKVLLVPAKNTARIQEVHILIGHIICDLVEEHVTL